MILSSLAQRQAFRRGFLSKCAEAGLTAAQVAELAKTAAALLRGEKTAFDLSMLWNNPVYSGLGSLAGSLGSVALPAALVGPPVLGGLAGYGLAKATDMDDTSVQEVQKQETIDELRRAREMLARKRPVYRQR